MHYQVFNHRCSKTPVLSAPWPWLAKILATIFCNLSKAGRIEDRRTGEIFMQWDDAPMRVLFGDDPYANAKSYIVIQQSGRTLQFDVIDGACKTPRPLRTRRHRPRG